MRRAASPQHAVIPIPERLGAAFANAGAKILRRAGLDPGGDLGATPGDLTEAPATAVDAGPSKPTHPVGRA
jgi:hypothetical protein